MLTLVCGVSLISQSVDTILYKKVDSTSLLMAVDYPDQFDTTRSYPALVFFFGGGWNGGTMDHFAHHARYFSRRGLVCFRADYR